MRQNKGKKLVCGLKECTARNCIINVSGKTRIEIAIKIQLNKHNLRNWKSTESGLIVLFVRYDVLKDTRKQPIAARH